MQLVFLDVFTAFLNNIFLRAYFSCKLFGLFLCYAENLHFNVILRKFIGHNLSDQQILIGSLNIYISLDISTMDLIVTTNQQQMFLLLSKERAFSHFLMSQGKLNSQLYFQVWVSTFPLIQIREDACLYAFLRLNISDALSIVRVKLTVA